MWLIAIKPINLKITAILKKNLPTLIAGQQFRLKTVNRINIISALHQHVNIGLVRMKVYD